MKSEVVLYALLECRSTNFYETFIKAYRAVQTPKMLSDYRNISNLLNRINNQAGNAILTTYTPTTGPSI